MLDYSSVLIKPTFTNMYSRSQVNLIRKFKKFAHSPKTWEGIPIMISNMDTTGTFEMHKETW